MAKKLSKGLKYMKNLQIRYIFIALIISLTGCATKQNVHLSENFWQNKKQRITVVSFKAPEPQVYEKGSQGLLDIAVCSVMNKNLNNALKRTDLSWYNALASSFAHKLKEHHIHATVYPEHPSMDKKSDEALLTQISSDKLLTIKLRAVGARRQYHGFIPMGAPEAYCVLEGELIDPKDKKVWWRHETEVIQPVQGNWDQPPNYTNFNDALHIAVREAKEELLDSFFSGH